MDDDDMLYREMDEDDDFYMGDFDEDDDEFVRFADGRIVHDKNGKPLRRR